MLSGFFLYVPSSVGALADVGSARRAARDAHSLAAPLRDTNSGAAVVDIRSTSRFEQVHLTSVVDGCRVRDGDDIKLEEGSWCIQNFFGDDTQPSSFHVCVCGCLNVPTVDVCSLSTVLYCADCNIPKVVGILLCVWIKPLLDEAMKHEVSFFVK